LFSWSNRTEFTSTIIFFKKPANPSKYAPEVYNGSRSNWKQVKQLGKAHLKTKYALLAHILMSQYLKELKSGKMTVDKIKVQETG
jgi:hypothetical protein